VSALIRGACHQIQSGALTALSQPHLGPTLGPTQMPAVTCILKMTPATDRIDRTVPKATKGQGAQRRRNERWLAEHQQPSQHNSEPYGYD
jgi:hypothetical protein